ncbi:MAG: hypothetical protein Q9160_007899 [Pyrenula sp. 1 TL-2023]
MSFEYVDGQFKDLADSMTAYIRQNKASANEGEGARFDALQDQKSTHARGRVFATETCIDVRWQFLALPITLIVMSAIFILAMILMTVRKDRTHAWKSSSLALLFSGLDDATRQKQGVLEHLDDMMSAAEKLKVGLRKTDQGWHFVENK